MAINTVTLMRWHKWIGLLVCIPLIAWSLSGVLHPIMSRVKPTVAQHMPPSLHLQQAQLQSEPTEILKAQGITSFYRLSLVQLQGNTWYRIQLDAQQTPNNTIYINSQTGKVWEQGEQAYAKWLARYYSGDQSSTITGVELVHKFSPEYPSINRLLPVWRVQFDRADGLRAFVEPSSSRLGKLVDTKTHWFKQFFFWFHDWSFLDGIESLRIILLSGLCFLAFVGGITGIWLYIGMYRRFTKPKQSMQKIKQYHRVGGLIFSIALLMFSASGVLHALTKFNPDTRHLVMDTSLVSLSSLSTPLSQSVQHAMQWGDIQSLTLHNSHGQAAMRLQVIKDGEAQSLYLDPNTNNLLGFDDKAYAQSLASRFSQIPASSIASIEKITHFTNEYGFINKRLPVWKVSFDADHNLRYYIETSSGRLAAKYNDISALERSSFTNLHKFGVLDVLGRDGRDSVMAFSSFALIIISILGCYTYLKRRKRS